MKFIENMGVGISIEEQIRRDVQLLKRQGRRLDREIHRMTHENNTIILKIKNYAKKNNIEMVKALSKEYIIYKNNIVKLTRVKGQMSNIQQKMYLMKSTHEINRAIWSLTQTMKTMNQRMGLSNIQNIIMEFETETIKAESMAEVMDDALGGSVDEDEEDELVESVLDEIGVSLANTLASAPSLTHTVIENELESRFRELNIN